MGEGHLRAVRFAAGTAAFIACIERAAVVSLFAAHWRVWAFLVLNLLLLAILFTSSRSEIQSNQTVDRENGDESEIGVKKTKQNCRPAVSMSHGQCRKVKEVVQNVKLVAKLDGEKNNYGEDDGKGEGEGDDRLSKEELNRRVEDFIAMFRRRYLISDAKGKSFGAQVYATSVCVE